MTLLEPHVLKEALRWISVVSCILSVLGCLFIITIYWAYPTLRKPARRLLLLLSITDLGTAACYLVTILSCYDCKHCGNEVKLCFTIFSIYLPVSSFLWTDCIAIFVFGASYQKKWVTSTKKLFFIFHIISWIIPLILVLTVVATYFSGSYNIHLSAEFTPGWCWTTSFAFHLIGGKAVEIFSIFFLFVIYFATYFRMRKIKKFKKETLLEKTPAQINSNKINELLTRLALIPLIFVILRSFGTLRVILFAIGLISTGDFIDEILQIGQAFCDPLQGFCNAILFLLCVSAVRIKIFNFNGQHQRQWVIKKKSVTLTSNLMDNNETSRTTHTITSLSATSVIDTTQLDL